eukprot:gnl/TRDRNA2_/TRDRNA2_171584_c0_seq1.p1 gnl/TRDRNA2_/TRDRNA2_171584_c0~~gnl/TRDRNA2_/TRDRNA2_171584_c0_seq1.p1  ORF type:complete len:460 (+),score=17.66 gnl/TRDRNA2_/TRDRNA2_171584_c0_seq1:32-1381(+)
MWFDAGAIGMRKYINAFVSLPCILVPPASYLERRSVVPEGSSKWILAASLAMEGLVLFFLGGETHVETRGHEIMALSACAAALVTPCLMSKEWLHGAAAFLIGVHGWSWMTLGFYWSPDFSLWGIGAPTNDEHRNTMFLCAHWLVGVIWLSCSTVAYKSISLGARGNLKQCAFVVLLMIGPGFGLTTLAVTILRHRARRGELDSISYSANKQYAFFLCGMSATAVASCAVGAILLWYHRKILKQLLEPSGLHYLSFISCQPGLLLVSAVSSWLLASCSQFMLAYVSQQMNNPMHIFFTCCCFGFYVFGELQFTILNWAELMLAEKLSIPVSLQWNSFRTRKAIICAAAFAGMGMAATFAFREIIDGLKFQHDGVLYQVVNTLFLFFEYCAASLLMIWPATWVRDVASELHASREHEDIEAVQLNAPAPQQIGSDQTVKVTGCSRWRQAL